MLIGLVAACGGAKPRPEVALPAPPPSAVEKLAAGSTLVVVRPTPRVARMSLWFDAGSRDGTPPQLAAASAYWAEEHTGASVRVLPDGTELSLLCDTHGRGVEACVGQLARAFGLSAPSQADCERLRAKVRQARVRSRGDGTREADELAFEALFGKTAASLFPLGAEADDAQLDPKNIQRFLGEFYRPARALLIAAGDVDQARVSAAFDKAASKQRSGAKPREALALPTQSGLQLRAGKQAWLSFALATPSTQAAAAVGFQMQRLYPQALAKITNLRGARVLHLRMPAGERPARRLQRAVFDLRRLALETAAKQAPRPEESLENLTRLLGEDWAARGPIAPPPNPWPLGVALVVNTESAAPEDLDKKLQTLAKEAQAAITAGERNSLGETRGTLGALAADVTGEQGAEIHVRRRQGDAWMSAVVRFAGGSELDSATRHGRSALLATLMSDSCRFTADASLDARLIELGVSLTPLVSPTHVGLLVTAPSERWSEALDAVLRCALGPSLTSRALDDARLKLLRTLWAEPEPRLASALGHLLTPTAPGSLAPWGSPQTIASVHINEIRRLHAELAVARRLSILAVSDAEVTEVARFIARRVAALAPGEAAPKLAAPSVPEGVRGELTEEGALRAIVGVRVTERGADPMAARVFADLLGEALAKRALVLLHGWGERNSESLSSGVALALQEEALTTLDRSVRDALSELQHLPDAAVLARLVKANLERAARSSTARGYARAFFSDEPSDARTDQQLASFRRLSQATPAFFVLRPAP
ncbi:MAG: hypothetical protein QM778_11490 [Myxococcales bacterium]